MTVATETLPTPAVAPKEATEKVPPPQTASPSSQQYRMVALDLDGTLLNSQHELSEGTKACLRRLDQQGFIVAIATGRGITTVYDTVKSLHLPKPIPVVCSNGAQGYLCTVDNNKDNQVEKELLFSTPVPLVVAKRTPELAKELGYVTQCYVGEEIYADPREPHHYELTNAYIELTGSKTKYVTDDFQAALAQGLPSKQLVLCRTEEQDAMMHAFETELAKEPYLIDNQKRATIVKGNLGWFMEILHPHVNKGNGLRNMCRYLKMPLDQCIAFGDGDNDLEFLQMAGRGYAMKNARDVVKDIADEVIEYTNDQDGVAKTLQALEEQNCLLFEPK